jgi:hypothetical protein
MQKIEKLENNQIVETKKKNVIEHLTGAVNPSCSDTSTSNSKTIPTGCVCSSNKTYKNAKGEKPNNEGTNGPFYCQ